MFKRMMSGFLALVLVVGMLPMNVWAEEIAPAETIPEITEEITVPETTAPIPEPAEVPVPPEEETVSAASEAPTEAGASIPETTGEEIPETSEETVPTPSEETVPAPSEETVPEVTEETIPEPEETVPLTTESQLTASEEAMASIISSGTCGEAVTWTLDDTGTLTISGTGAMADYNSSSSPWYNLRSQIQHIVVEDGVSSIGNNAFYFCYELIDVSLPSSVTSIGYSAFSNCRKFTGIVIPNSVTTIGMSAFRDCSSLANVTLPNSITAISDYLFSSCSKLENVTIPDSVTSIGDYSFSDCSTLTTISISEKIVSIGHAAFSGCTNLASIAIAENNPNFRTENGIVYETATNKLLACPGNMAGDIIIPDGVTAIEFGAFEGCTRITSVILPDSITFIGYSAFSRCSSLRHVTLPKGLTAFTGYTFDYCPSLSSIVIPDSVTSIGSDTFRYCTSLSSILIPANVTSIGTYAFSNCSSLNTIIFQGDAPTLAYSTFNYIHATAYYPADNTTWSETITKTYGGTILWEPYVSFGTCGEALSWILNTDGELTIFGTGAMENYAADSAPWAPWANQIKTLIIEKDVTAIGENAFANCNSLTSVYFLGDAPQIAASAFTNVTASVEILTGGSNWTEELKQNYGGTLTWISYIAKGSAGSTAVWTLDETGLLTVSGTGQVSASYSRPPWQDYCENVISAKIETGITSLGTQVFKNCVNMTSITLPDTLTTIGSNAFYDCESLKEIEIPSSVTSLGSGAFYSCDSLVHVDIPNSITAIEYSTFSGCSNLTSVTIPDSVTSIGYSAFYFCRNLRSISIPDSVTSIGRDAFSSCESLTSIKLPAHLTTIEEGTFEYCRGLTRISIPHGVTSIGKDVFYNCSALTSIIIPSSVVSLDSLVFYYCTNLSKITFLGDPPSITDVNNFYRVNAAAYYDASNPNWTDAARQNYGGTLTWVPYTAAGSCSASISWVLDPQGILTITGNGDLPDYAAGSAPWYAYREQIKSLDVREGIASISANSFAGFPNLVSVTLAGSVASIEANAFGGCGRLNSVIFLGDAPSIAETSFTGVTADLCYPGGNDTWTEAVRQNYGGTLDWADYYVYGVCGDSLSWYLSGKTGTLTISGSGDMYDYTNTAPSWANYHNLIGRVVIKDGVTSVGKRAFHNYTVLQEVVFGKGLATIGESAFRGTNLKTLVLPDNVTSISATAFRNCANLTEVTFGKEIAFIGEGAFSYNPALTKIIFPGKAPMFEKYVFFQVTADVYYDTAGGHWNGYNIQNYSGTLTWKPYIDSIGSGSCGENLTWDLDAAGTLTISGSGEMTSAPWSAHAASIQAVLLEEGITSIASGAFRGCTELSLLILPQSITAIGSEAFSGCTGLTSISFLGNAPVIAQNSFASVTAKVYCPENASWTSDVKQNYGGTLTWISGVYSGSCGPNLIWVLDADGLLTISGSGDMTDYPWYSYHKNIRTIVIEEGVTSICNSAFVNCSAPSSSVTLPSTLRSIGSRAFSGMTGLTSIELPDQLNYIGSSAFQRTGLTSLVIPDRITILGSSSFANCTQLASLTLGKYTMYIDSSCFANCTSLTSVTFPATIERINSRAFSGCSNLAQIEFKTSFSSPAARGGMEDDWNGYEGARVETMYTNTTDGLYIETDAFAYCDLTEVSLPATLAGISSTAFEGNMDLKGIWVDAKPMDGNSYFYRSDEAGCVYRFQISPEEPIALICVPAQLSGVYKIPDSVTSVSSNFMFCSKLTELHFGAGCAGIYDRTEGFFGCTSLKVIKPGPNHENSYYQYVTDSTGTLYRRDTYGNSTLLFVPAGTTEFTIPADVTAICECAFSQAKLKNIRVAPENTNYISINGVLYNADGTELLAYPRGRTDSKFMLPAETEELSSCAFAFCDTLQEIWFQGEYVYFSSNTFYGGHINAYYPEDKWEPKILEELGIVANGTTANVTWIPYNSSLKEHTPVSKKIPAVPATDTEYGTAAFTVRVCSECGAWLREDGLEMTELEIQNLKDQHRVYAKATSVEILGNVPKTFDRIDTDKVKLTAAVRPAAAQQIITWSSGNPAVASVDQTGLVTFLTNGTVTITATGPDRRSTSVTFTILTRVRELTVPETVDVRVGESVTPEVLVSPASATNQTLTWTVDPAYSKYITVSSAGKITIARSFPSPAEGYAQVPVTVETTDGSGLSKTICLNVHPLAQDVVLFEGEQDVTGKTLTLDLTKTKTLTARVLPGGAGQAVTWSSSSERFATVENGVVRPLKAGTVIITAKAADGSGKTATVKFTIVKAMAFINLPETASVAGGSKLTLTKLDGYAIDTDASNKNLNWSMTDETGAPVSANVATLSNGILTAKAVNIATSITVRAEAADGLGAEDTCLVTIYPVATGVSITGAPEGNWDMTEDASFQLKAEVAPYYPENEAAGASQAVTWKSSSTKTAVIAEDGTVTCLKPGTVTFTATTTDGSKKSASVKVTIFKTMAYVELPDTAAVAGGKSLDITRLDGYRIDELASNTNLNWTMSYENEEPVGSDVATLSRGVLRAQAVKRTQVILVRAEAADGSGKSDECVVSITPIATEVTITDAPVNGWDLRQGDTFQLGALVSPFDPDAEEAGASQTVTWKSSNTKIANIDDSGKVTCLTPGTVTFTATATDGSGKKDSVKITLLRTMDYVSLPEEAMVGGGKSLTFSKLEGYEIDGQATNTNLNWSMTYEDGSPVGTDVATLTKGTLKTKAVTAATVILVRAEAADGAGAAAACTVTIRPLATRVEIQLPEDAGEKIDMTNMPAFQLSALVSPIDPENEDAGASQDVTWKSSSTKIADIDEEGNVTCLAPGSVTFTAATTDGSNKKATLRLTIVKTMEFVFLPDTYPIAAGKSLNLTKTEGYLIDTTASDKALTWALSYEPDSIIAVPSSVATLSTSGVLNVKKTTEPGTVLYVHASAASNPDASYVCEVTVYPIATGVEIMALDNVEAVLDMTDLDTFQLSATVLPYAEGGEGFCASQDVVWTSSNPKIAVIDRDGFVTCLRPGTVTFTAAAMDGSGKEDTFRLTIVKTMETLELPAEAFIGGGKRLTIPKLAGYRIDDLATNKKLTWTLTDLDGNPVPRSVASISSSGILSTKACSEPVTVIVTAASTDGSDLAPSFPVTIYPVIKGLKLLTEDEETVKRNFSLPVNEAFTFYPTATNEGTAAENWDPQEVWLVTSSNEDITEITWNDDGSISVAAPESSTLLVSRTVRITVKAQDGSGKSASFTFRFSPALPK